MLTQPPDMIQLIAVGLLGFLLAAVTMKNITPYDDTTPNDDNDIHDI
jgi:hypothetical protein